MSGLAASHLQLEVSHERILLYGDGEYQWDEVLEAVSNLDCKAAQLDSLKLFSDLLTLVCLALMQPYCAATAPAFTLS